MGLDVRSALVVAFVVALTLSTAGAIVTEQAHLAAMNSESITASVQAYDVDADSSTLRVTVRIQNPTRNRIVVRSMEFDVYANDTLVANRPPSVDGRSISSGESVTLVATIPIRDGQVSRLNRSIERGTVRLEGYVWGRIKSKRIAIRLVVSEES